MDSADLPPNPNRMFFEPEGPSQSDPLGPEYVHDANGGKFTSCAPIDTAKVTSANRTTNVFFILTFFSPMLISL